MARRADPERIFAARRAAALPERALMGLALFRGAAALAYIGDRG
jgi:hypothetical protein